MSDYNYAVFDMANELPVFDEFRTKLHVGERPPSFDVEDLATGEAVQLSSLWKKNVAIIEFGSFT